MPNTFSGQVAGFPARADTKATFSTGSGSSTGQKVSFNGQVRGLSNGSGTDGGSTKATFNRNTVSYSGQVRGSN